MNNDDLKFIEVFVDIIENGVKVPFSEEFEYLVKLHIKPEYFNSWKQYINRKFREFDNIDDEEENEDMIDKFDEWYDNLTIDNISEADIRFNRLPNKKIRINIGLEEILMQRVYNLFMDSFNKIKPLCIPNKYLNCMIYFSKTDVGIGIWSERTEDEILEKHQHIHNINQKFSQSKQIMTIVLNNLKSIINDFNDAQGEKGIHIKYTSTKNNGDINIDTTQSHLITISRHSTNIFYSYNKSKKVSEEYMNKLFTIIPAQTIYAINE